jgi:type IV secretion system protein VirB1
MRLRKIKNCISSALSCVLRYISLDNRSVIFTILFLFGISAGVISGRPIKSEKHADIYGSQRKIMTPKPPSTENVRSTDIPESETQHYSSAHYALSRETVLDSRSDSAPEGHKFDKKTILIMADQCAPTEPAIVLTSIARVESGYDSFKISVNGPHSQSFGPNSRREAIALAYQLILDGKNIDLGLAQINSKNMTWLGASIDDLFDPCKNLMAASKIMEHGYKLALKTSPPDRSLLETAYSFYNTGRPDRGFANGYVKKIVTAH